MSLKTLSKTHLPLNRNKQFYTSTVFPMIVCKYDFMHFPRFTALLTGYREQPIDVTPQDASIQFFTEYTIADSISGAARRRFPNLPETDAVPDILIMVAGRRPRLIAIEAEMFGLPSDAALNARLEGQAAALAYIGDQLQVTPTNVYQYALLPAKLLPRIPNFRYPIVTWDAIYNNFMSATGEDYFLNMLRAALELYDEMVDPSDGDNGRTS